MNNRRNKQKCKTGKKNTEMTAHLMLNQLYISVSQKINDFNLKGHC